MNKLLFLFILTTFSITGAYCQKFSDYQAGEYYDLKGTRYQGFIYYNRHVDHFIKFKADSEAKPAKLKPWKLNSFKVLEDSFIVFKDFYYEGPGGGLSKEIMDFVQVIDTGLFNLYKHYAILSSGPGAPVQPGLSVGISASWDLENYLMTQKGSDEIILIRKKNEKKFIEQMIEYFQDYPEIVEGIQAGEYGWEDMPKVIQLVNLKVHNKR